MSLRGVRLRRTTWQSAGVFIEAGWDYSGIDNSAEAPGVVRGLAQVGEWAASARVPTGIASGTLCHCEERSDVAISSAIRDCFAGSSETTGQSFQPPPSLAMTRKGARSDTAGDRFLPEKPYPAIVCQHTLEHLENLQGAVGAIAESLKLYGVCYIETPDGDKATPTWQYFLPEHAYALNKKSLTLLFQQHGFEVVNFFRSQERHPDELQIYFRKGSRI